MDFITGLPRSRRQHDSIWVIMDRMTKSAHFFIVKTTHSTKDYARLYIQKVVRLPLFQLYQIGLHNLLYNFGSH